MTEGDIQAISSLKEDERVYQEITAELSGMVIGGDISGIPENTELKPGESTSVQIEIPKNYFGTSGLSPENEECLIRMLLRMGQLSLRSVLAQSGLDMPIESPILLERDTRGNLTTIITLKNHHPHATIVLPQDSLRYFRLFVPGNIGSNEIQSLIMNIAVNQKI